MYADDYLKLSSKACLVDKEIHWTDYQEFWYRVWRDNDNVHYSRCSNTFSQKHSMPPHWIVPA